MKSILTLFSLILISTASYGQLDSMKFTINGQPFDTLTWDQTEISYNSNNVYDTYYTSEILDTMVYIDYVSDGISLYNFKAGKTAPSNQNYLNNQVFAYTLDNVSASMSLNSLLTPLSDTIYFWIGDQGWGVSKYIFRLIEGTIPTTANIGNIELQNFKLFPNPASDKIEISFETNNSELPFEIYTFSGTCVFQNTNLISGFNSLTIDVSAFHSGIYLIKVGSLVQKLIVK